MTRGKYLFDYGDMAGSAPVVKMYTLGHTFVPPGIHAGGLRYHGMSPSVSALVNHGDIQPRAVKQLETFEAALQLMRTEGIIPAPESAHAVRVAIDEALKCKQTGEKKVIAFNLSGHGHFDTPALALARPGSRVPPFPGSRDKRGASVMAYEAYNHGQLEDYEYPFAAVEEAMAQLPAVPVM
jgi:tryptophan synthase beta chain